VSGSILPHMVAQVAQRFETVRSLSQGSFGQVLVAKDKDTDRNVVIKKIVKRQPGGYRRITNEIKANILLKERSGTCKFHGFYSSHHETHLVFDHIEGMDLFGLMKSRDFRPLPEHVVRHILRSVSQTLVNCHHLGMAHRDVKLENIMVTPHDDRVYLIDFGLCSFFSKSDGQETPSFDYSGSESYMSPEIIQRKPVQATLADAWALGVTAYALLFGAFPYSTANTEEVFKRREDRPLPKDTEDISVSAHMRHKVSRLLCIDPSRRATVEIML